MNIFNYFGIIAGVVNFLLLSALKKNKPMQYIIYMPLNIIGLNVIFFIGYSFFYIVSNSSTVYNFNPAFNINGVQFYNLLFDQYFFWIGILSILVLISVFVPPIQRKNRIQK